MARYASAVLCLLLTRAQGHTAFVDDTYYKILGVQPKATTAEIQKAFRELSLKYHPDKNPKYAEKYKEATLAYETLTDERKRRQYDQLGAGYHQREGMKKPSNKIPKDRTQSMKYRGCFNNTGSSRIDTDSHAGCTEPEVCASIALRVGKETFALRNPRNCSSGRAECVWLDAGYSLPSVSWDLCEEKPKSNGASLGGNDYLAVYTIPPDKWDWEEPDHQTMAKKKREEEERMKASSDSPWLFAPTVLEAKQKIETLKELRRGANANFDFELSAKRTKDLNEAERELKKLIKRERTAHKRNSKATEGSIRPSEAGLGEESLPSASDPHGEL